MKNILIIGKSGLIGKRVTQVISEKALPYKIYSASRQVSNHPEHIQIDVTQEETLNRIKGKNIDLILLCTNDQNNNVLKFCIDNSIDYLDITKPNKDLQKAYKIAQNSKINSRIIFGSGWMGGIIGGLIPSDEKIKELKLYIYYSLDDLGGKSSVDFLAENITKPFSFYNNNKAKQVKYFSDPEKHQFNYNLGTKNVYNFDLPDLFILNHSRNIPNISAKLAYNSEFAMNIVRIALSIGLFSVLSANTKKALFQSKGKGDKTTFDINFTTNNGNKQTVSLECSKGQSELTANSTVLNIEKLFTKEKGIYFSHEMFNNSELNNLLEQNKYIKIKSATI